LEFGIGDLVLGIALPALALAKEGLSN